MSKQTFAGKTVEKATDIALDTLGVKLEDVEISVVNPGRSGILGFGGEAAEIEVRLLSGESAIAGDDDYDDAGAEAEADDPQPGQDRDRPQRARSGRRRGRRGTARTAGAAWTTADSERGRETSENGVDSAKRTGSSVDDETSENSRNGVDSAKRTDRGSSVDNRKRADSEGSVDGETSENSRNGVYSAKRTDRGSSVDNRKRANSEGSVDGETSADRGHTGDRGRNAEGGNSADSDKSAGSANSEKNADGESRGNRRKNDSRSWTRPMRRFDRSWWLMMMGSQR